MSWKEKNNKKRFEALILDSWATISKSRPTRAELNGQCIVSESIAWAPDINDVVASRLTWMNPGTAHLHLVDLSGSIGTVY